MNYELYHGDCLDILPTLEAGSVDAIVTDPPFKLSQSYSSSVDADNLLAVSGVWGAARCLYDACRPGAVAAVIYDNRLLPLGIRAFMSAGWVYLRTVTLYRRWGTAYMLYGWMSTSDIMLVFTKPGVPYQFYGTAKHDVYIRDKPEAIDAGHVAQKPLEFINHVVSRITPPNGVVIDPYMGSGTTGHACGNLGRRFIGIEKDEHYFDVARERIATAYEPLRHMQVAS